MRWYGIVGCALTAWSPLAAVLFLYLGNHPQLIMIAVSACFAFMIGSHVAALVWLAIPPLRDVPAVHVVVGALVIEAARYAYYRAFKYIEGKFGARFKEVVYLSEFTVVPAGLAAGAGWAAGQSLLGYGILVAYVSDPSVISENGSWYEDQCPVQIVFANALLTFFYTTCNMAWMVSAFAAYHSLSFPTETAEEERPPYARQGQPLPPAIARLVLGATIALHLCAACFTLLMKESCTLGLILVALLSVLSILQAYRVATQVYHKFPPHMEVVHKAMLEAAARKKEEAAAEDRVRSPAKADTARAKGSTASPLIAAESGVQRDTADAALREGDEAAVLADDVPLDDMPTNDTGSTPHDTENGGTTNDAGYSPAVLLE
eukprot:TRINITY_DN10535_c2_g1_i2.p1 TRINITY_DN10535_c2_g1~~TRINITY_DN10535_c2_g1_i2.p1  ORF type:complete len:407 (+),score=153.16 TRINITY_DN10535_c2_g1_i2:96-1223(+)